MTASAWEFAKEVAEDLDYGRDFTDILQDGEEFDSAQAVVDHPSLTLHDPFVGNSGKALGVWASGGEVSKKYIIDVFGTTNQQRTFRRSLTITVIQTRYS